MTLFTVEGLIRAGLHLDKRPGFSISFVHEAYDQWYDTQRLPGPPTDAMGAGPTALAVRAAGTGEHVHEGTACFAQRHPTAWRASRQRFQGLRRRDPASFPTRREKGEDIVGGERYSRIDQLRKHEETTVTTKGIATRTGICSPRYVAMPESLSSLHFQPTQRVGHDGNLSELAEGGP